MSVDLSRAERDDQRRAFSEMVDANPNHWYWRELAAVEMTFMRILIGQEAADALLNEQFGFIDFLSNPYGPFKAVYEFLKGQRGMAEEAIKESGKWDDLKASSHEEYLAQRRYLAAFSDMEAKMTLDEWILAITCLVCTLVIVVDTLWVISKLNRRN